MNFELQEHYQNILREKFISAGIKLLDPKSVFFNYDTKIGKDVIIEPNVFFGPNLERLFFEEEDGNFNELNPNPKYFLDRLKAHK